MYEEKKYLLHLLEILKKTHIVLFQNNVDTQTLSRHQLTHTHQQHTKLTLKPFEKIFKNNDRGNKFYQISKTEKKSS